MSYFRESFEYQPIQIFLNSNVADVTRSRGDIVYNLKRTINLPADTIGYCCLRELTMPNTNYNLSSSNNTLVLMDSHFIQETFTITPGNYTVNELKDALNAKFAAAANASYHGITVTYDSNSNKYKFTDTAAGYLNIQSTSTMNSVLGFESGFIDVSVRNALGSTLRTTIQKTVDFSIVTGTNSTFTANYNNGEITHNFSFRAGGPYPLASYATTISDQFVLTGIPFIVSYDAVTHLYTFTNTTTNGGLVLGGNSLASFGFNTALAFYNMSSPTSTACTLTSQKIVDLSGNNSFYFTTNLSLNNQSFLAANNMQGQNVLQKIQLTTESTGVEFFSNVTSFKSRFYDTNISSLHIVLYDEDFLPWVPSSDWSCVLELIFYEKYDVATKTKPKNLLFAN
jgi:hypothetical protein